MKRLLSLIVVLTLCGAATAAPPATRPIAPPPPAGKVPLPTMDELEHEFNTGDYKGTIRDLTRVLSLKGKAADGYDHYDLLMMRAETLLRLKDFPRAAAAFGDAAKAGESDEKRVAAALAMQVLAGHVNRDLQYVPAKVRGKQPDPIDIIDPEHRKEAFVVLFHDEWESTEPLLKKARTSETLPPIGDALTAARNRHLQVLELAAEGKDEQFKAAMSDVKERAVALIGNALEKIARRADEIDAMANSTIRVPKTVINQFGQAEIAEITRRRGLSMGQTNELKALSNDCNRLQTAANQLAAAIGDRDQRDAQISGLAEQANDLRVKMTRTLKADYGTD